jgi:mono/diheme cytochrome c family protein
MWNHQTAMKQPAPSFSQEEMRQLLGYIWMRPYFRGAGDPARGRKVFMAKNCAACHDAGANGAPKLGKTPDGYSDVTMMSTLWDHGPRMLELMNEHKLPWPTFTAPEMTDLIAYLNSL